MALPTTFGNQTVSTGAQLDNNFAALGAISRIPGTIAGTNALTLTPLTDTPTVAVFANGNVFAGIAVATNTTAVTLAIGSLGPLPVYKDIAGGPVALVGGEIQSGNTYGFVYDSSLNSGNGGFHLQSNLVPLVAQRSLTFTSTNPNTSQDQNVTISGVTLGDMIWLGPPTSVIAGVVYMGYVPAAGTVAVRALNGTTVTLTPTGGTFQIGVWGRGS